MSNVRATRPRKIYWRDIPAGAYVENRGLAFAVKTPKGWATPYWTVQEAYQARIELARRARGSEIFGSRHRRAHPVVWGVGKSKKRRHRR